MILLRWMNIGEKGVKAQEKFLNKLLNSKEAVVKIGLNKVNAKGSGSISIMILQKDLSK